MSEIIILSGIPCAGKSTWAEKQGKIVLSLDKYRESLFNKYVYSKENEKLVKDNLYADLDYCVIRNQDVIIDNTHCKEGLLDKFIKEYGSTNKIVIKFFDISLWKSLYRNIIRYLKTGEYIPIDSIVQFHKNYKKINREKYAKYTR